MRTNKKILKCLKKIYPKNTWKRFEKHIKDNNIICRICGNLITVEEWLGQFFDVRHDNYKRYICDKCYKIKGGKTMVIKKNECRVYYKGKDRFLPFEKELKKLFENNGFEFWASGYDMCDGIRDLCFERKTKVGEIND